MDRYIVKYWQKDQTEADAVTDTLSPDDLQELTARYELLYSIRDSFTPDKQGSADHQQMIQSNTQLADNNSVHRIATKYSAMNCYWQVLDTTTNLVKSGNTQLPTS